MRTASPTELTWYLDPISPFAWLHWASLWPVLQQRASTHPEQALTITIKPVLFAGLLKHWGQKGPAELPGKRPFTYQHCLWLGRQHGIPIRFPAGHPFNPLPLLRLMIAAGSTPAAVDACLRFVWDEGLLPDDAPAHQARLQQLSVALTGRDLADVQADNEVRARLREHGEQAIADQVFGVPTVIVRGDGAGTSGRPDQLFWGFDAREMLLQVLDQPDLILADAEYQRVATLPQAAARRESPIAPKPSAPTAPQADGATHG